MGSELQRPRATMRVGACPWWVGQQGWRRLDLASAARPGHPTSSCHLATAAADSASGRNTRLWNAGFSPPKPQLEEAAARLATRSISGAGRRTIVALANATQSVETRKATKAPWPKANGTDASSATAATAPDQPSHAGSAR